MKLLALLRPPRCTTCWGTPSARPRCGPRSRSCPRAGLTSRCAPGRPCCPRPRACWAAPGPERVAYGLKVMSSGPATRPWASTATRPWSDFGTGTPLCGDAMLGADRDPHLRRWPPAARPGAGDLAVIGTGPQAARTCGPQRPGRCAGSGSPAVSPPVPRPRRPAAAARGARHHRRAVGRDAVAGADIIVTVPPARRAGGSARLDRARHAHQRRRRQPAGHPDRRCHVGACRVVRRQRHRAAVAESGDLLAQAHWPDRARPRASRARRGAERHRLVLAQRHRDHPVQVTRPGRRTWPPRSWPTRSSQHRRLPVDRVPEPGSALVPASRRRRNLGGMSAEPSAEDPNDPAVSLGT